MASTRDEFEDAILEEISKNAELRAKLELIPEAIAATVTELTPVDEGTAKASIEAKSRLTAFKNLSTRAVKIGEVYSDDDYEKINTLEYGRGASDKHGATPEFAMFRKAATRWYDYEIRL